MKTKRARMVALLAMSLLFLLSGCGPDPVDRLNVVQEAYPGGDVRVLPGYTTWFVVRDVSGGIWFVKTHGNANPAKIAHKALLFDALTPASTVDEPSP